MNSQADLPRLVRELRERTGLTQEKFAAKLGVTYPTINRRENGRAKPSPLALKQIEEMLPNMGKNGADLLQQYFDSGTPGDITLERLEEVLEQIERIGDDVQAQIQERLSRGWPMPKLKRLLVFACFQTVQRWRHCSRDQEHVICQGDKYLVIKEYMSKSNYCMECAVLILGKAQDGLTLLIKEGVSP